MNLQKTSHYIKTSIFSIKSLLIVLSLASFLPQSSSQFSPIGHCHYHYDSENRYSCRLTNAFLTAANQTLEIIGEHLPGHSDSDVRVLFNQNSTIIFFNTEILSKFGNLQFLDMSRSIMVVIAENAFENCRNLRELRLRNNILANFTSNMFGNCENLRLLDVSNSWVERISANLFGSTGSLEEFIAETNQLTSIPEDVFRNMRNLRVFNVRNNSFTDLNPNLLRNSMNLEEFDVSLNNIQEADIIINVLNGQTNLRRLRLINSFSSFNFTFFAQFQRLEELAIAARRELTGNSWQSLPASLRILEVHDVGDELPENAFQQLVNLNSLIISGDGIEVLHPGTFTMLTRLESLTVIFTQIKTLHPQIFASQANLQTLMLDWNQIEELPAGVFAPLGNLGAGNTTHGLRLFQNRILRLNSNIFGNHPFLGIINFSANRIERIERGTFGRFSNLRVLDLSSNRCVRRSFENEANLDEHEDLEWCYNNWDGITTTTPSSAGKLFTKFDVIFLVFTGVFIAMLGNH